MSEKLPENYFLDENDVNIIIKSLKDSLLNYENQPKDYNNNLLRLINYFENGP